MCSWDWESELGPERSLLRQQLEEVRSPAGAAEDLEELRWGSLLKSYVPCAA